jgi:hypothetical protein
MIEYIHGAIKASAGQDIDVVAEITTQTGEAITEDCKLHIFDKNNKMICEVKGVYAYEEWTFTIPAEATKGRSGRHMYCFGYKGSSLCFKQPIYFV